MNVLILSDSGHSSTARKLCDLFQEHGDECEVMDCLAFLSDTLSQTVAQRHNSFRRYASRLSGGAFQSAELFQRESNDRKLLALGVDDLGKYLRRNHYDLVLCMHAFAAIMLLEAVKKYQITVPVAIIDRPSPTKMKYPAVVEALRNELTAQGLKAVINMEEQENLYETLLALTESANTEAPAAPPPLSAEPGKELRDTEAAPVSAPAVVKLKAPTVQSALRHQILRMPAATYEASGIIVNGRRLKSFVFTTDLAIIRNCDADAVFAVYPFTPQQAISDAIIKGAFVPVFCGVGGGTTKGPRTVSLAKDVESQGAMGVVLNAPISNPNLRAVAAVVDIPVVITVVNAETNIARRLESGASIINVAGAAETPDIVRKIREKYPEIPIIASGGSTNESILETIRAGANAITYTPPSTKDLFRVTMSKYREM